MLFRFMKLDKMGKDFAANLNVEGVRIVAPIWERGTIGIEVPNAQPQKVSLRSLIASEQFQKSDAKIPVVLGQTIDNEAYILDLKSRLLIVGDDEKGKAAALNTIITSLLYKNNPSQVKFVMIDPNGKDLMLYQSLPKMFFAQQLNVDDNVITDYDKIIDTLESLRIEMKRREKLIDNMGCYCNIDNYNKLVATGLLNPAVGHKHLPYIVVVINNFDELIRAQRQAIEQKIKELVSGSPVSGWLKVIRQACKNMRFSPPWFFFCICLLSSKSPYLSSPAITCPDEAKWTRIWCVRPVLSSASSSVNPG